MKVLIYKTALSAASYVADLITKHVEQCPDTVLGLATGGTMEPVYERLVAAYKVGCLDFSAVHSFNLDEYVGLPGDHLSSFGYYMRRHLFDHVNIQAGHAHIPCGNTDAVALEALRYEQVIMASGGVDLQLLGIGKNGHIGFNEPPADFSSLTHVIPLTQTTREANARYFNTSHCVPEFAITMGVGTIMRAKEIVLLATGAEKADAVANMIDGPFTPICPASALQDHSTVTVVLDQSAATKINGFH